MEVSYKAGKPESSMFLVIEFSIYHPFGGLSSFSSEFFTSMGAAGDLAATGH